MLCLCVLAMDCGRFLMALSTQQRCCSVANRSNGCGSYVCVSCVCLRRLRDKHTECDIFYLFDPLQDIKNGLCNTTTTIPLSLLAYVYLHGLNRVVYQMDSHGKCNKLPVHMQSRQFDTPEHRQKLRLRGWKWKPILHKRRCLSVWQLYWIFYPVWTTKG